MSLGILFLILKVADAQLGKFGAYKKLKEEDNNNNNINNTEYSKVKLSI